MTDSERDTLPDPIRHAAQLIAGPNAHAAALERRLKQDIIDSIGRIKPDVVSGIDFDADVMQGDFFADLPPSLQGIAIARTEGTLAFYNRVGWHPEFLQTPLTACVPDAALGPLGERYHASTLHDLAYVHPRHFEKMLGKAEAASLWETLKHYCRELPGAD